jgi:hypothetical protein
MSGVSRNVRIALADLEAAGGELTFFSRGVELSVPETLVGRGLATYTKPEDSADGCVRWRITQLGRAALRGSP